MAQIDSRIAMQLRPVEFPSPLESAGKVLSLRDLLDQGTVRELQRQQLQMQMDDKQRSLAAIANLSQTLPPDERARFEVNPQKYIEEQFKTHNLRPGGALVRNGQIVTQVPEAFTLSPGQRRIAGGQTIAEAPHAPTLTEVGVPGQAGYTQRAWVTPGSADTLPVGAPKVPDILNPDVQAARQRVARAGASNTTVNIAGKEADKAYGKWTGETFGKIQEAGLAAPADIGRYQQLGNLLSQVNTGRFAGRMQDFKAAAKGLGFDLSAMGVRDDVAPAQAAKALSAQMALELRNPAGGAGMPGALSDKDREFLQSMVPSIENDPAAIKQMIDYRVRIAKRGQEVAALARRYAQSTGRGNIDDGFFEQLQQFSNANPLFPEAAQRPAGGTARVRRFNPQTGRIE